MKLSELIEMVKLNAGQSEIDLGELKFDDYRKIVEKQVAPFVSKHKPFSNDVSLSISSSPYTFTAPIPKWISEVHPINNLSPVNVAATLGLGKAGDLEDIRKPTFLWEYVKPKLYVQYTGDMLVKACYNIEVVADGTGNDYDINYLDGGAESNLIDLATGYAMRSIGRNRRNATLEELPVSFSADDLVSEGEELIKEAKGSLQSGNRWWMAVG